MYNKDINKKISNNFNKGNANRKEMNPKSVINTKKSNEKKKKQGSLKSTEICKENNKIEDINHIFNVKNKKSKNKSKTRKNEKNKKDLIGLNNLNQICTKNSKYIEKDINDLIGLNKKIPIYKDEDNNKNKTKYILNSLQKKNQEYNNNKSQGKISGNHFSTPENILYLKSNDKFITKGEKKNNNNYITNFLHKKNEEEKKINYTNCILIILENNGNTTYINCSIQCLANFKNITDYYLNKLKSFKTNENNMTVTYHLSQIFSHLLPTQEYPQNPYPLKPFHEFIIKINPIFKGKSTKNISDFFIYLLDILHKEDKKIVQKNFSNNIDEIDSNDFTKYMEYLNNHENSIIFQKFSWINKKVDVCWGCKKEETKYQYYFTYDLDFENAFNKTVMNNKKEVSILDCIAYASEKKKIYNSFCSKCNKKNIFERISSIYLSRSILVLLIRGMEDKKMIEKIINENIKIKINQKLDLSKFIENKNASLFNYTLHGVIFYDSEKLEYLAYSISQINERWHKYTNGEIIPCELNNFIDVFDFKTFPVILFYKHY